MKSNCSHDPRFTITISFVDEPGFHGVAPSTRLEESICIKCIRELLDQIRENK